MRPFPSAGTVYFDIQSSGRPLFEIVAQKLDRLVPDEVAVTISQVGRGWQEAVNSLH